MVGPLLLSDVLAVPTFSFFFLPYWGDATDNESFLLLMEVEGFRNENLSSLTSAMQTVTDRNLLEEVVSPSNSSFSKSEGHWHFVFSSFTSVTSLRGGSIHAWSPDGARLPFFFLGNPLFGMVLLLGARLI